MDTKEKANLLNQTSMGRAALRRADKTRLYEGIDLSLREAWTVVEREELKNFLNWLTSQEIDLNGDEPVSHFFHDQMVNNGFDDLLNRYRRDRTNQPIHRGIISRLLGLARRNSQ
jgi:hypothetical protein